MDEATANIDVETDHHIQESIRANCAHVTVLTIAHRVQTIIDSDRVLVMENGHIVEFDTPARLISNAQSTFARLVHQANIQNY